MLVLKTKFRSTPRGVKIVSKKDRKEMIDALEKLCYTNLKSQLAEVITKIYEKEYGDRYEANKELLAANTSAYVNGDAGIGLGLLGKIADRVGFTCVFQVKFPSRESTLILE